MKTIAEYADLQIRIRAWNDEIGAYPVEAYLGDGSFFPDGRLHLTEMAQNDLRGQILEEAYGRSLSNLLFAGPIRTAYERALGQANGRVRIRLRIEAAAAELHALRWERLQPPEQGPLALALARSDKTPFSRYLELARAEALPLQANPIKMLIAMANPPKLPKEMAPVPVAAELNMLLQALGPADGRANYQVTLLPGRSAADPDVAAVLDQARQAGFLIREGATNLDNLAEALEGQHILHFVGHGSYHRGRTQQDEGHSALFLEQADAETPLIIRDQQLAELLAGSDPQPQFIFLTACESAHRDEGDTHPFVGLAPKLIKAGVPAVIAMQAKIPMAAAQAMTADFYRSLRQQGLVDKALNLARRHLEDRMRPWDWEIPVLFMRSRSGQLFAAGAVRTALTAMRQHSTFNLFATGDYFNLPIDVIHTTMQQNLSDLDQLDARPTAAVDLLKAVEYFFESEEEGEKDSDRETPHLVMLAGGFGMNKTTQAQRIAWESIKAALVENTTGPQVLPLYLDLGASTQAGQRIGLRLENLILAHLQPFWPGLTAGQLRELLATRHHLHLRLIIDGSDNLHARERRGAWQQLRALVEAYPHHQYLLVTDAMSIAQAPFEDLAPDILLIQPIAPHKMRLTLAQMGQSEPLVAQLLQRIEYGQLTALASIPWFLIKMIMQAKSGVLPTSSNAFIQRQVEDAVARLPAGQGMQAYAEATLNALAWHMHPQRDLVCPVRDAFAIMAQVRGNREYNLEMFYEALVNARLLARVGDEQLRFTYPPLQSYCAARALLHMPDRALVLKRVTATLGRLDWTRWWNESLTYLCQMMAGDTAALDDFLQELIFSVDLFESEQIFLAARCYLQRPSASEAVDAAATTSNQSMVQHLIELLSWRLDWRNESRLSYRVRAIELLGQLAFSEPETIVPTLVDIASRPRRPSLSGREDYYFSDPRYTAATALTLLRHCPDQEPRLTAVLDEQLDTDLKQLFNHWDNQDIEPLITLVQAKKPADVGQQSLAALILGYIGSHHQAQTAGPTNDVILDCLGTIFLQAAAPEATLWAVTHALAIMDAERVTEMVLRRFIEQEQQRPPLRAETAKKQKARIQQYKYLAYLIGRLRSQEPQANAFLTQTCLKEVEDKNLWSCVIEALGWISDRKYKPILEDIALAEFSFVFANPSFTEQDKQYLQYRAIEALAQIGDRETIAKLRPKVARALHVQRAFYRTSQEIEWRQLRR